jgi:hypothetical protein
MAFRFGPQHALVNRVGRPPPIRPPEEVDRGTCARCGANVRAVRVEHQGAVKGDDDWSDLTACTNEKCPEYVP